MNSNFKDLGITPPILRALDEMGFAEPTEVQGKAIPHILNQEDVIVMSKTGSGKTAVYGVSMLQLIDPDTAGPQALILAPTRELAVQVDNDLKKMANHLKHKTTAIYGQHSMNTEIQALDRGVSIVTGTPGRVYDHINQGNLKTRNIRFLVLDEADRMLDMGFLEQVVRIIKTIPKDRITLLFSATIPADVRRICRDYMKNPVTIEIESQTMTVDTIRQLYYRVDEKEKRTQLNRLLLVNRPESCIIFCNTRIAVDRVQSFLSHKGYASQALHGDIPQGRRLSTIQQFKKGDFHILVATDVAARGIHVDDLAMVINYDVPVEKDSYVHRIGRTGRAGNDGIAISLVTSNDIMGLYEIEEHIGTMIAEAELPTEAEYNEHKAEADEWVKANALKPRLQKPAGGTGQKETGRKPSGSKPAQQNKRHRDTASEAPANNKQTGRTSEARNTNQAGSRNTNQNGARTSGHTASGNTSQTGMRDSRQTSSRNTSHDRPVRTGRPVQQPPRNAGTAQHGRNTEAKNNTAAQTKKPFFKRMLDRIFGR